MRQLAAPVVVRTIDPPPSEWSRYSRDLNLGLTQSLDAVAEGVSLARQITEEALSLLADGVGDGDLSDFFGSRASLPFIRELEGQGIISAQNRGRLLRSDGLLSDEGKSLAIRQISAAVLPDADLLELVGAGLRNALARSAPWWMVAAANRGEWDIRHPVEKAIRDLLAARAQNLPIRRHFQQVGIFERPHSADDPIAMRLLVLLDKLGDKPAVFSRVARAFASEAQLYGGAQATLLAPRDAIQSLDEAARTAKVDLAAEVEALR